jgi:hypothetical protein
MIDLVIRHSENPICLLDLLTVAIVRILISGGKCILIHKTFPADSAKSSKGQGKYDA